MKIYPFVSSLLNKTIIFWEDMVINHGAQIERKGSVAQSWAGQDAIQKLIDLGYDIIVSSSDSLYLDCGSGNFVTGGKSWCDPFKTWQTIYDYEPSFNITFGSSNSKIVGAEMAVWTEQVDDSNIISVVFPRASAGGERFWSPKNNMNSTEAVDRILTHRERLVRNLIGASPIQPTWCHLNPGQCNI
jgi:hexosaminidase